MEAVINGIDQLFQSYAQKKADRIEKLPQSGSDRVYFRIYAGKETFIATWNLNVKENNTFIKFSNHFNALGLPVPQVFCMNEEHTIYIQQDLGQESLLDKLEQQGKNDASYALFQQSLKELAHLQIKGHEGLNYDWCLTAKEFAVLQILFPRYTPHALR